MKFKELTNKILFYISVPKCVCCGEKLDSDDLGICKKCKAEYEEHKTRNCSRCNKKMSYCTCTNFFLERHFIKKLFKTYRYKSSEQSSPGNMLIYSLKQDNRRDVIEFLANETVETILHSEEISNPDDYIITNVPRRKKSIKHYGFDHTEQLAKSIGRKLNIKFVPLFKSNSKKAQKETSGEERLKNVKFAYRSKKPISLIGKKLIIVDDIVTTGASIGTCATLAHGLKCKQIYGAVLAIAYKDAYIPFTKANKMK